MDFVQKMLVKILRPVFEELNLENHNMIEHTNLLFNEIAEQNRQSVQVHDSKHDKKIKQLQKSRNTKQVKIKRDDNYLKNLKKKNSDYKIKVKELGLRA